MQADGSARSRLVGRGAPELLHGGGAALGADDDLVGAVDRGEGELADGRLVLGEGAHAAAGLDAVRQLDVDAGLDLVVAVTSKVTTSERTSGLPWNHAVQPSQVSPTTARTTASPTAAGRRHRAGAP